MTENNAFNMPMGTNDPNFMIPNMLSNMISNYPTQQYSLGDLMNTPLMSINLQRNTLANNSINEYLGNSDLEERFINENGTIVSASSLATLLASRFGSRGNLNEIENPPLLNPLDFSKNSIPNNHHEVLNSAFANSLNPGYDTVYGEISNNKWAFDKYLPCSEYFGKESEKNNFPQFQIAESIDQNQWTSSNSSIIDSNKDLSLSLATCHHPIVRGTIIPDQCSEINGSIFNSNTLNERHFGSKSSYNNKNLSVGTRREVQIAQFSSGSRYLCVIQEILAQIASFSLENFDGVNYPASVTRNSLSQSCVSEREYSMMDSDGGLCGTRERETEAKKQQLVALLQVVDEQHNQCLDEIHTVISAFHAATELNPRIHARFALQTVSALYKNLRERISNQILSMAAPSKNGENTDDDISFETSFIQKQWALQQLRKKDHQLWRPQRGLPERSVSVLRAWMFQNFLHPYPKDAEKHLLAVKSGLTRSQVSNWFINARVRLWKPMIEEMYAEMNRRKGRRNGEDPNNGHKSRLTIDHLMFDM